jgi:hypothetical protein
LLERTVPKQEVADRLFVGRTGFASGLVQAENRRVRAQVVSDLAVQLITKTHSRLPPLKGGACHATGPRNLWGAQCDPAANWAIRVGDRVCAPDALVNDVP